MFAIGTYVGDNAYFDRADSKMVRSIMSYPGAWNRFLEEKEVFIFNGENYIRFVNRGKLAS
jgi:hypothetical protein